jgi:hypothetical protein
MFDSIDKICTKNDSSILAKEIQLNIKSFKRSLTKTGERKTVEDLWLNVDGKRAELKEACTVGKWGDDSSEIEENIKQNGIINVNLLMQLYPNRDAPSDHPPVAASVNFFLPNNKFISFVLEKKGLVHK